MSDDVDGRCRERAAEPRDTLTPEEAARLGRAMARVLFVAWRATQSQSSPPRVEPRAVRAS
jgi:hypothetical protein